MPHTRRRRPTPMLISHTKKRIPTPIAISHTTNKRPTPERQLPTPKWCRRIRPTPITNAPLPNANFPFQKLIPHSREMTHSHPVKAPNIPHSHNKRPTPKCKVHPNPLNQSVDWRLLNLVEWGQGLHKACEQQFYTTNSGLIIRTDL